MACSPRSITFTKSNSVSMPANPNEAAVVPPPISWTFRFESVWPVWSIKRIPSPCATAGAMVGLVASAGCYQPEKILPEQPVVARDKLAELGIPMPIESGNSTTDSNSEVCCVGSVNSTSSKNRSHRNPKLTTTPC